MLNLLGAEDFGIYNVVGGIVIMFSFLNSAMTASTQRFLTIEIAEKNTLKLKRVFSLSVTSHIIIALVILLLSETIGVWFLNKKLIIPTVRMEAANWIFQLSIFTSIVTILSVPYNAAIIAHERMGVFAKIGILEVGLKLAATYTLYYLGGDKMILYSAFIFAVSLVVRIIYGFYCARHFKESKYYFFWDRQLFIEMMAFAGWNLFGVFAGIGYNQGVNILLNVFFGPIVNAARGIAFQVMGAINQFVTNFQIALNPAITKLYARQDERLNLLICTSAKFSYFLLLFFIIPILFKTDIILRLWLKTVPKYTTLFTQLVLIDILIACLSGPLQIVAQATGKVRRYQLIVSIILLLNLPLSYILLRSGYGPEFTFIVSITLSLLSLLARLMILKKLVFFPVGLFLGQVIGRILLVTVIILAFSFLVPGWGQNQIIQIITMFITTSIFLSCTIWILGLSKSERANIANYIKSLLARGRAAIYK
ncbi:MAG TPA: hypothetical protein VL093_07105 [Flavipsychrobacter sp.]|nr:hypothetical protein [Flavipsychrobacter sp.]